MKVKTQKLSQKEVDVLISKLRKGPKKYIRITRTKALLLAVIIMVMLSSCVSSGQHNNRARSGAGLGAGAGVLYTLIKGGNSGDYLKNGGIAAVLGYIIGNETSQQTQIPVKQQPQYRQPPKQQYESERYYEPAQNGPGLVKWRQVPKYVNNGEPRTKCRKVITRKTVNGVMTETIEEVCTGTQTNDYY